MLAMECQFIMEVDCTITMLDIYSPRTSFVISGCGDPDAAQLLSYVTMIQEKIQLVRL